MFRTKLTPKEETSRLANRGRNWDDVGGATQPSWYLDPLVAAQKQAEHLRLTERWAGGKIGRLLKTDLFEEANGADQLLFELLPRCESAIAIDISLRTAARARSKCPDRECCHFVTSDLRGIGLASESVDLILSNSSLDHFESAAEFDSALNELIRLLRPGGRLIITLDNPLNPLYWPLKWIGRMGWAPYPLGYTPTPAGLISRLQGAGLTVIGRDTLIHNPRLISTALFLGLRRGLGRRADFPVKALLQLFALLGRLPTRRITASFFGVCAVKPE
jgi:SAM-dependent methyltransferase